MDSIFQDLSIGTLFVSEKNIDRTELTEQNSQGSFKFATPKKISRLEPLANKCHNSQK